MIVFSKFDCVSNINRRYCVSKTVLSFLKASNVKKVKIKGCNVIGFNPNWNIFFLNNLNFFVMQPGFVSGIQLSLVVTSCLNLRFQGRLVVLIQ